MSGSTPSDPYGQPPQNPYGQPPQNPYGQAPAGYGAPGQYGVPQYGGMPPFASWLQRVGAYLVDSLLAMLAYLPGLIGLMILGASVETTTDPVTGEVTSQLTSGSGLGIALIVLGALFAIAFTIWNLVLKQGRTGYTIGKGLLGIKLVSLQNGQPIGPGLSFVRQVAHILDSLACNLGYLWPLWDAKRQTFADKVMSTVVVQQPKG